jgi:levansucrase
MHARTANGAMKAGITPSASAPGTAPLAARWTADHVRRIADRSWDAAPVIGPDDFTDISDELDFWDAWPVQEEGGLPAVLPDGSVLWMALGAPHFSDPDERHGHARIHLLRRSAERWEHLGQAMPEGFSPGSREWSGSAVLAPAEDRVILYFTATGRSGEGEPTFEQRLFRASASLARGASGYGLQDWGDLREIVRRDPAHYMASNHGIGGVGTIKAFRDPAYFRDPADGRHYLFFAASAAGSDSAFNGVIGAAVADGDSLETWQALPPVISADGLNNELERPHAVRHAGRYYMFWSTQRHVFDPRGPAGPTGLYGMVSESLAGGWEPLNGTGLVFANPPQAPQQAYSWLVMPDLQVTSFVDDWGHASPGEPDRRFGGTFAPMLRLRLDGAEAGLAG